jgi:hypothetical protein
LLCEKPLDLFLILLVSTVVKHPGSHKIFRCLGLDQGQGLLINRSMYQV